MKPSIARLCLEAHRSRLVEALKNTHDALDEPGFVRCERCGWQESTADLDVMSMYIKPALSATTESSQAWLTQRDEAITAPLKARVEELETLVGAYRQANLEFSQKLRAALKGEPHE